jgi:glycine/D-amino acid oxidase-like deaminating enzyme
MEDAVSLMPNLKEAELIEHSAGIECWQPGGGLPMLGRLPAWDNVYLATWTGPFGIQWSPAVGRIMADLIVNGKSAEAEPFDPARNVK